MPAVSSTTHFPITTLRVNITGENNLQSFYDKPLGRHYDVNNQPDKLSSAEYGRIAKAAGEAGIERIIIGGGSEPLLRKDVASIVKALCSSKKIQDVRFVTNGIFLKDYADSLRRAGLRHVEINLDSLNFLVYQKVTRRDGLYRVLDGIQKAERVRFDSLIVNVFLLRGVNDRELVDFAIMTKTRPLHVRFLEYIPNDAESTMTRQLYMPLIDAKRVIQDFQALLPISDNGSEMYRFKGGDGVFSFAAAKNAFITYSHPMLVLNSQGDLYVDQPGSRNHSILKDLEKEGPEDKLQRVFQKYMSPTSSAKAADAPSKSDKTRDKASKSKTKHRNNSQVQV